MSFINKRQFLKRLLDELMSVWHETKLSSVKLWKYHDWRSPILIRIPFSFYAWIIIKEMLDVEKLMLNFITGFKSWIIPIMYKRCGIHSGSLRSFFLNVFIYLFIYFVYVPAEWVWIVEKWDLAELPKERTHITPSWHLISLLVWQPDIADSLTISKHLQWWARDELLITRNLTKTFTHQVLNI